MRRLVDPGGQGRRRLRGHRALVGLKGEHTKPGHMGNLPKFPKHDGGPYPCLRDIKEPDFVGNVGPALRADPQTRAPVRALLVKDGRPDHPSLRRIDGVQHIEDETSKVLHVAMPCRRARESEGRQIFSHLIE
eukprot:2354297-Amphidinium_carterae.2